MAFSSFIFPLIRILAKLSMLWQLKRPLSERLTDEIFGKSEKSVMVNCQTRKTVSFKALQADIRKTTKKVSLITRKVIVFSGIDGSGKSTHARRLTHELRTHGKSVKYLWMRGYGRVFFSLPLLVLSRLLRVTRVYRLKSEVRVSEYPFYAYKPLRLLWPWLQLVDSLLYSVIFLYCPFSCHCDIVVMDRSTVDTLVDVVADTHIPHSLERLLQSLFIALLPSDSLILVLDVSEKTAMNRKKDVLCIPYLKIRRKIYKCLAKKCGWYIVSTDEEFDEVHRHLSNLVFGSLKL